MANIYVRLPYYVCAFYRGLDPKHQLDIWEPYEFKDYTHEGMMLQNNPRFIPEQNQSGLCYSERAWQNMLHGKAPEGGKVLIKRDPKQWLEAQEICLLSGRDLTQKQESLDYLCIAMPKEVIFNSEVRRTNQSFALDYQPAYKFTGILRQEFYHVFLDWYEQDLRHCNRNNMHRSSLEVMERFLCQYNIPISVDGKERETLRRMKNRWLEKARKRPNDRLNFGDDAQNYLEHFSEDDIRRKENFDTRQRRINARFSSAKKTKDDANDS